MGTESLAPQQQREGGSLLSLKRGRKEETLGLRAGKRVSKRGFQERKRREGEGLEDWLSLLIQYLSRRGQQGWECSARQGQKKTPLGKESESFSSPLSCSLCESSKAFSLSIVGSLYHRYDVTNRQRMISSKSPRVESVS